MKALDVGPIPVVENARTKRLVGLVTDRDLALKVVAAERHPVIVKIEEVMTRDLVTCAADDQLDKAMQLMAENQLRRIPVTDNEGAIIGIIAQADVATKATAAEQTGKVVEEISRPRATTSRMAGGLNHWSTLRLSGVKSRKVAKLITLKTSAIS